MNLFIGHRGLATNNNNNNKNGQSGAHFSDTLTSTSESRPLRTPYIIINNNFSVPRILNYIFAIYMVRLENRQCTYKQFGGLPSYTLNTHFALVAVVVVVFVVRVCVFRICGPSSKPSETTPAKYVRGSVGNDVCPQACADRLDFATRSKRM